MNPATLVMIRDPDWKRRMGHGKSWSYGSWMSRFDLLNVAYPDGHWGRSR